MFSGIWFQSKIPLNKKDWVPKPQNRFSFFDSDYSDSILKGQDSLNRFRRLWALQLEVCGLCNQKHSISRLSQHFRTYQDAIDQSFELKHVSAVFSSKPTQRWINVFSRKRFFHDFGTFQKNKAWKIFKIFAMSTNHKNTFS